LQLLAVERNAAVKRLDRRHLAAETAHKDDKRPLNRAVAATKSLSEVLFDVED